MFDEEASLVDRLREGDDASARHEAADEIERMKGLLWFAWYEFNAIRDRDGAPTSDGVPLVAEEWWSHMTEAFAEAIGPDAQAPWPSEQAKKTSGLMENY